MPPNSTPNLPAQNHHFTSHHRYDSSNSSFTMPSNTTPSHPSGHFTSHSRSDSSNTSLSMPPNTTPPRPPQQLSTPSRPQRVAPNRFTRPQDIIARSDLARILDEERRFAEEQIVARIDYILAELQIEKDPERRRQGWAALHRLRRDDLEDCNRRIKEYRLELTQRDRAVAQYESEYRDDVARRS